MKKFSSFIITFILFFSIALPSVQAFYSPILAEEANLIQAHITESKQKNGVGSFYDLSKKLVKNRQEKSEGKLTIIFFTAIADFLIENLVNAGGDFMLLFRYWAGSDSIITTCLRDDLWEIQILQEQVINEMFKAALTGDAELAFKLLNDYDLLDKRIKGGTMVNKKGVEEVIVGLSKSYTSSYWFPSGSPQLYLNCPYGEYEEAIQRLKESIERMRALGKPGTFQLGSFKSMSKVARQRAIVRARQWIAANQLKFSIGGPQGSNPKSLVSGPGFKNGLWKDLLRELGYIKDVVNETTIKTIQATVGQAENSLNISDYSNAYQQALDSKKLIIKQVEQALVFNLSLKNVSETSLIETDRILTKTNTAIKSMYDKAYSKEATVTALCELLSKLAKSQCTNKTPNLPSCT